MLKANVILLKTHWHSYNLPVLTFYFILSYFTLSFVSFNLCQPSQLEQVCINLSAEVMQHFYNTHIFKSSIESCREECVLSEIDVEYFDNVPCIDFISSLVSTHFVTFIQCAFRVCTTLLNHPLPNGPFLLSTENWTA